MCEMQPINRHVDLVHLLNEWCQIKENTEINNIKQIMGLQHGKVYQDTKSLRWIVSNLLLTLLLMSRYGHILIMADQDHDGSHIKGLVINMISTFWPSLLQLPGFLQEFVTPIVKVWYVKSCSPVTGHKGCQVTFVFYPDRILPMERRTQWWERMEN